MKAQSLRRLLTFTDIALVLGLAAAGAWYLVKVRPATASDTKRMEWSKQAYANYQDRWLVQPMFLSPKAQKSGGYACSTAQDAAGILIVDEAGHPISDQVDIAYALP